MRTSIFKIFLSLLLAVSIGLPLEAITVDEVPNVHVRDRNQYVSNPSGILSQIGRAHV